MKKLLLSLLIMTTAFCAKSQTYLSTNHRQDCFWNEQTKKMDNCVESDGATLFTFNKEETIIHHTTATISSDYYVQSHYLKDGINYYIVKSDVGNSYIFLIDLSTNQIGIIGKNGDDSYLITHTIKRAWTDN